MKVFKALVYSDIKEYNGNNIADLATDILVAAENKSNANAIIEGYFGDQFIEIIDLKAIPGLEYNKKAGVIHELSFDISY